MVEARKIGDLDAGLGQSLSGIFHTQQNKEGTTVSNCIVAPNNRWKLRWDIYIMVMMISACLLIPWQLAFVIDD